MTNISQLKEKSTNYFTSLKNNKKEASKLLGIVALSIYLTLNFIGSYDSTAGYDVRGEFCGYLLQMSFLAFLYINFKSKESNHYPTLKYLSLTQFILALANFLIVKSLSTFFIFKIVIVFAAILLFLILVWEISK